MDIIWAFVYGLIQGVSEYLPVSSSGHLALLPHLFDLEDPGFFFDLLMHFGTALAVIIYFRKKIISIVQEYILILKNKSLSCSAHAVNFTVATVTSVIFIILVKDLALEYGRNSKFIAINLIVFGVILYLCDRKKTTHESLVKKISFKSAFLIGLSQVLAIFPGVSRSGITMSSARLLGQGRSEASEFSFLLSLPIIIGSIAFKIPKILSGQESMSFEWFPALVGILTSFFIGIITIHFFLKMISRVGFGVFAVYRILLGIIILILI